MMDWYPGSHLAWAQQTFKCPFRYHQAAWHLKWNANEPRCLPKNQWATLRRAVNACHFTISTVINIKRRREFLKTHDNGTALLRVSEIRRRFWWERDSVLRILNGDSDRRNPFGISMNLFCFPSHCLEAGPIQLMHFCLLYRFCCCRCSRLFLRDGSSLSAASLLKNNAMSFCDQYRELELYLEQINVSIDSERNRSSEWFR